MKQRIIILLAAFALVTGLATATAPTAEARVADGQYSWQVTKVTGIKQTLPVTIRGDRLTLNIRGHIVGESKVKRFHHTRNGGFFDFEHQRYTFVRAPGGRYTGVNYLAGINIGRTSLTPR